MIRYCPKCALAHLVRSGEPGERKCTRCGATVWPGTNKATGNKPPTLPASVDPQLSPTPTAIFASVDGGKESHNDVFAAVGNLSTDDEVPDKKHKAQTSPAADGMIHCLVSMRGPRVLADGKDILIGRESYCDIRIIDPAVSREHARIEWREGGGLWLVDLKSRNGTFVNSKPIREHRLHDQDKIRISSEHFVYRQVASMTELRDSVRLARSDARKGGTTEIISAASFFAEDEFRGALGSMGMPEICQMILLARRSGRLCLLAEGEKEAYLHFVNGQIYYAETSSQQGEEAALHILSIVKGYFTFQPGITTQTRNVVASTEKLLFEAMRLLDEKVHNSG